MASSPPEKGGTASFTPGIPSACAELMFRSLGTANRSKRENPMRVSSSRSGRMICVSLTTAPQVVSLKSAASANCAESPPALGPIGKPALAGRRHGSGQVGKIVSATHPSEDVVLIRHDHFVATDVERV